MKLAFVCTVLMSLTSFASTQNIRIQAIPSRVIYRENDMVLQCTIPNPSQIQSVFLMDLQKNTSTDFEAIVTVSTGQAAKINDIGLQNRATATGSLDSPSSAQLKLTIDKNSVRCPADFLTYRCTMSGLSLTNVGINYKSTPITIEYDVKPTVIEMPRVRILNAPYDTPDRMFPVATALQLTCEGQVGSDSSKTIRWCAQKANDLSFTGLAQTPIHSQASLADCQYTRSSTITYNLTSEDTFTKFLCESGDTGLCGTGTAIQYVNISIETSNEGSGTTDPRTADDTSDAGIIAGGVIGGLAALILIILLVYFLVLRRKTDGESSTPPPVDDRTKEDVPGYNGPANPEGPVYSVPVKDNPPHERQHRRKHPRDEEDRRKYRGHENNGLDEEHTAKSEKEEIDYQNHGYSNRMMSNDYGDDGDVPPRGQPPFGSAV